MSPLNELSLKNSAEIDFVPLSLKNRRVESISTHDLIF